MDPEQTRGITGTFWGPPRGALAVGLGKYVWATSLSFSASGTQTEEHNEQRIIIFKTILVRKK